MMQFSISDSDLEFGLISREFKMIPFDVLILQIPVCTWEKWECFDRGSRVGAKLDGKKKKEEGKEKI